MDCKQTIQLYFKLFICISTKSLTKVKYHQININVMRFEEAATVRSCNKNIKNVMTTHLTNII